jgi:H+-transporting ATPase
MSEKEIHEPIAEKPVAAAPAAAEEEDEDEDIDELVMELQSNHAVDDAESDDEEENHSSSYKEVPDEYLHTDPSVGLTSAEVTKRKKKFGLNQMAEDKENMVLKFCMFFIGPIQFVMEAAAILA